MRHLCIILAVCLLALPLCLHAAGVQSPSAALPAAPAGMQNVEEPDSGDDEDADKEMKGEEIPGQSEKAAVPPMPTPDVKPVDAASEGDSNYDRVMLQGLNKVTARAQEIEAPIGSVVRFGTIEIVAHSCWKSAPDERPENAALLEISEIKQGEAPTQIFLGWMFSSTPGLSALEHPFYDVSVVKCEKARAAEKTAPVAAPAKAPAKKK